MRRLIAAVIVACLAGACGDDGPTGPQDQGLDALEGLTFLTLVEYEGYLADVQSTIPSVNVMIAEFGAIANDFNAGFLADYWIGVYTRNLLKRVGDIRSAALRIRPRHPELLKLHVEEYEAALEDFEVGFGLFVQGIEQPGSVTIDDVNDRIVGGNTHLIRLQILLGDLGGRRVDFFAAAGGGGGGFGGEPDIGF